MAFSSEGSFSCHIYCDTRPRFIRSHPKDRCNEVFWPGLKIDPGFIFQRWILNPGCFFSVENWDRESLKIYPGSFFNSYIHIYFFQFLMTPKRWILTLLNIDSRPRSVKLSFLYVLIHCASSNMHRQIFRAATINKRGGGVILNWLNSLDTEKVNYIFFYIKLFLIRYSHWDPAKHP